MSVRGSAMDRKGGAWICSAGAMRAGIGSYFWKFMGKIICGTWNVCKDRL